ncbi:hypothetical protein [Streptomyces sp. NPDC059814]|uniref:hypothetical protein n=1 Tax=Streptomyces sp. NPDC059814 TaxID=3346959 RepID=UPI00365D05F6
MTAHTRRLLVSSGIISAFDFAPGFPALLPGGLGLIERMHAQYEAEAGRVAATEVVSATPLLNSREYRDAYDGTHSYSNVYEVDGAEPSVLRPDGLRELVLHRRVDKVLLCRDPLFRAETTDARPLIREKHVWAVCQMVHQVVDGSMADVWTGHRDAFLRFMDAMLIPTLVVEAPPLRRHAQRRILTFTRTPDGRTWLTCTLYHLDDDFVARLGARGSVIELGYTAKLIAMGVALHEDRHGVCLPSRLAPAQALVPRRAPEAVREVLRGAGLRVHEGKADWTATVRTARRTGAPLVVSAESAGRVRLYTRGTDATRSVPLNGLAAAAHDELRRHDRALWERAVAFQAPLLDPGGEGTGVRPAESGDVPGLFRLGRPVDANTEQGRAAVRANTVLMSDKQRIY